jgi:3-dehydroquinate synthase
MAFTTLTVTAPDKPYPIHIGSNLFSDLPNRLAEGGLRGQPVVVTNDALKTLYGEPLAHELNALLITIPEGEQYKNLEQVRALYDSFVSVNLDRQSVIIALGGGVIGDTVGFAASTYLRGVPFVQIPTTLLSMVDSSVGGKVGVNLPQGKNLVGAFKQPELVLIDTDTLKTLPDVERRCGLAEVIKHGFLSNNPLLLDPAQFESPTADLIAQAVSVKIDVVQRDPYEQNIRAYLNLGHTFAQAIEPVSEYTWRHGEAVAVGLVAAARLSYRHGLCNAELPAQVERLVRAAGLPTTCPGFDPVALRKAMDSDKKRANRRVRFVLLRSFGEVGLYDDVAEDQVMAVLEELVHPSEP